MHDCDVVVVGAGLAGLTAARELSGAGLDVRVLEARDRVGGRTLSQSVGEHPEDIVEVGGQWVGPTQHEVLSLAQDFGIRTYPHPRDRQEPVRGRARQAEALQRHDPDARAAGDGRLRPGGPSAEAADQDGRPGGAVGRGERRARWTSRASPPGSAGRRRPGRRARRSTMAIRAVFCGRAGRRLPASRPLLRRGRGRLGRPARHRGRRPAGPSRRRNPAALDPDGRGARRPGASSRRRCARSEREGEGVVVGEVARPPSDRGDAAGARRPDRIRPAAARLPAISSPSGCRWAR